MLDPDMLLGRQGQNMALISVTRLRVRSFRYIPGFIFYTHRRAMSKLVYWCNEAAVVHWAQENSGLPDWLEAHRKMVAEGRRSKVKHPSPAHETYEIAPPKLRPRS